MARRRRIDRLTTQQGARLAFRVFDQPPGGSVDLKIEAPGGALTILLPMDEQDLGELRLLVDSMIEHLRITPAVPRD